MSYRVLFVDDEGSVLRAISRNLSFQLDITTAYSAEEGLALLSGPGRFDAVVTDINMPGVNGLDFVEQAVKIVPGTPFIVLSGCGNSETLTRAAAMPTVSRVLVKPTGLRVVLKAIEAAIEATLTPAGNG